MATGEHRELRLTWRTWAKTVAFGAFFAVCGVVGLTAGAAVVVRLVGLGLFGFGVYWVIDVVVFMRTWRSTPSTVEIPSLLQRTRTIDLTGGATAQFRKSRNSSIVVSGPNGERSILLNPLVSDRDIRRFLDRAD